jgi:autotransporter-associated beta strand protein
MRLRHRFVSLCGISFCAFVLPFLMATADGASINKANNANPLNDPTSWASGVPGINDVANWGPNLAAAAYTAPMGGNLSWSGISLIATNISAVTIPSTGGFQLTLGSAGIDLSASQQNLTINAPLNLAASQSWNVGVTSGSRTLIVNSISGGNVTLSKAGDGILSLQGPNTTSGGIIVSAGGLDLNHPQALGTGTLTMNGRGINKMSEGDLTLTTNNPQIWGSDFDFFSTATAASLNLGTGNITLTGNRKIGIQMSGDVTVGGTISGNASLTVQTTVAVSSSSNSRGALVLTNANTYTGGTMINGALVRFTQASAVPVTGNVVMDQNGAVSVSGIYNTMAGWLADPRLPKTSYGALALEQDSSEPFNPEAAGFDRIGFGAAYGKTVTYTGTMTPYPLFNRYRVGGGGGNLILPNDNMLAGSSEVIYGPNGGGRVILTGSNNYTGVSTVYMPLQIGNGGTTGNLTGTSGLDLLSTVYFNRSDDFTFDRNITGSGSIQQIGTGTLRLTGNLTNDGNLFINNGGTVAVTRDNNFPATMSVYMNPNSKFSLENYNQSIASLLPSLNTTVSIAPGKTLTATGFYGGGGTITNGDFFAIGGGKLTVQNSAAGSSFRVGSAGFSAGTGGSTYNDFSGLGALTISLNTADGVVRVNATNTSNVSDKYSTLIMPNTGSAVTEITAAQLAIGDSGQNNGSVGQVNTIFLGGGPTTINVNTINIGTGTRDVGALRFSNAQGSLTIRNAAGSGGAALNIGTGTANTGITGTNTFDVRGHQADLQFGAVNIGTQPRSAELLNTFAFDQGSLTLQSLSMSVKGTGGSLTNGGNRVTQSFFNIGGGTVDIQGGVLNLGSSTSTSGNNVAGNFNAQGTINISGGSVNIGANAGTAIKMAEASLAGLMAVGTLNFIGGTTTINGNIVKVGGAGTSVATFNLNGGIVDMKGFAIGGATPVDNVILAAGTLRNAGQINNGGALNKTTAGTLTLEGSNTFNGPTTVSAGKLVVNGTITSQVTILANAVLAGSGTVTGNIAGAGNLAPGNSIGTLHVTGNVGVTGQQAFEIAKNGSLLTQDQLAISGQLTYGGTLSISLDSASQPAATFAVGDSWDLFNFSTRQGLTEFANNAEFGIAGGGGNLPTLNAGLAWDFDYQSGALSIVAIPEPGFFIFGLSILGLAIFYRRYSS